MTDVIKQGKTLKSYATHFADGDWKYTRDLRGVGLKHIRYDSDWKGRHSIFGRISRGLKSTLGRRDGLDRLFEIKRWSLPHFVAGWRVALRTPKNLPDGVLSGGIITFWEEDGEYIQMMQPNVGALVADFLIEEPNNPHAVAIAAEIERIQADYGKRLKQK